MNHGTIRSLDYLIARTELLTSSCKVLHIIRIIDRHTPILSEASKLSAIASERYVSRVFDISAHPRELCSGH